MIEIKSRYGDEVLYTAEGAQDVRAALVEAVREGADLRGADLRDADLRGADLGGAYLRGADLRDADLRGARWPGLHSIGMPSGSMLLVPHGGDEWRLTIGCWSGTVDDLESLIAGEDWPEAEGEERELRRPGLEALVALCRAHIGYVEAKRSVAA